MAAPTPSPPERIFSPGAAMLAWLWPGLGHISLGERKRGLLIMFGVLFLFVSGLLIGGLDCVDRRHDKLWFLAQGVCGPVAFAADYANQRMVQAPFEDDPQLIEHLSRIGIGRVNEMGTLFIALAGLMNLVVILDALYYAPKPQPPTTPRNRRTDK